MRRSAQVLAPLLASAAVAILTGCHDTEVQRCVDEQNHVVDPIHCKNLQPGQAAQGTLYNNGGYFGTNGIFFPHSYRYYYGGGGGGIGGFAGGGSYMPTPGHSYSLGNGTTRGGFGSLFSGAHGGGEGE